MKPALSLKHELFVTEYLKDGNATQAAIRAGYSPLGANRSGPRLLSNVVISQEIARRQKRRMERAEWQADEVLAELRDQAHSDIGDFFLPNGDLKPLHTLTREQRACISSQEIIMKNAQAGDGKIDRVLKIRLWDKMKALDLAMQHFKLLHAHKVNEDVAEVKVSVEVKTLATVLTEQELLAIRERLLERSRTTVEPGTGGERPRLHQDP